MTDYITVDTSNGPVRLPRGMSRAEMAEALNQLNAAPAQGGEGGGFMEAAGDVMRSVGSGAARGLTSVLDLPSNVAGLAKAGIAAGVEKVTGREPSQVFLENLSPRVGNFDISQPFAEMGVRALGGGGVLDYDPRTTAGEYAQTGTEFATGATVMGGPRAAIRYGLLPGLASEAAGQATEGTAAEPYARIAAPIVTSLLASPKPGAFPEGADGRGAAANRLTEAGVRDITVGQARQSQPLMRMEGRLAPTGAQLDDFTAATMRQIGSTAPKATPEALQAAGKAIVQQMDDAVRGVSIVPTMRNRAEARMIAQSYAERVPQAQMTPRLRGIANEIDDLVQKGKPVTLSTLKTWRSDIGKMTVSSDAPTREAAHRLRKLLDRMTDDALVASGREADIAKLAQAREAYRNFIGVRDAASRAGAEAGDLSPTQLNQSLIRAQGRENYATGRTTDMAEFTRSGAGTLRSAPTVNPGGERSWADAMPIAASTAAGTAAYGAGLGPVGMGIAAVGGATLPYAGQRFMRSNLMQELLRNPARAVTNPAPMLPGLLSQGG